MLVAQRVEQCHHLTVITAGNDFIERLHALLVIVDPYRLTVRYVVDGLKDLVLLGQAFHLVTACIRRNIDLSTSVINRHEHIVLADSISR